MAQHSPLEAITATKAWSRPKSDRGKAILHFPSPTPPAVLLLLGLLPGCRVHQFSNGHQELLQTNVLSQSWPWHSHTSSQQGLKATRSWAGPSRCVTFTCTLLGTGTHHTHLLVARPAQVMPRLW